MPRLTCAVVAVLALSACSGTTIDSLSADPAPERASSSRDSGPSPTDSSTDPGPFSAAADEPVAAASYRSALRTLARAETGSFEQVVAADRPEDLAELGLFPRTSGSWNLTERTSETSLQSLSRDGIIQTMSRVLADEAFYRIEGGNTIFGDDCWIRLPKTAQPGMPAALYLLDGYRPAGRPDAGTASLDGVLGALGFQKVANQAADLVRGRRVPVTLELVDGRFSRVFAYPSDLVDALDGTESERGVGALLTLLDELPLTFWAIDYRAFGVEVEVEAPPADRVLDDDDTCD